MSRTKTPKADIKSCESWIKKPIRDAYENQLGIVIGVKADHEGRPRLLAMFPGEKRPRQIALEKVPDGHYLLPGDVKARYRPPSHEDREYLRGLAANRS